MSINYGAFDTALNAAAGDDLSLAAELRLAFIESARRQLDLLGRSRCDANWQYSCYRLKGLAASFGVVEIIALAEEGLQGAPGDPVIMRRIASAIKEIEATD
ncbi:MAG: Hpt domain-containing protein [Sphingorhabdus sp.]